MDHANNQYITERTVGVQVADIQELMILQVLLVVALYL